MSGERSMISILEGVCLSRKYTEDDLRRRDQGKYGNRRLRHSLMFSERRTWNLITNKNSRILKIRIHFIRKF